MGDTLPLSQLRFGHERGEGDINARRANRDEGLEELAVSIKHYIDTGGSGLILPLAVELTDDISAPHYVIDGNRRLAALRKLAGEGVIGDDHPVPVMRHAPGQALSRSLAANITAVPLHPVDRYDCFAALAATMTEKEIAAAFALKPKQVKQALALGALAPSVRQAWLEGKIDGEAAKAFTLADPKRQHQALGKLLKHGRLHGRFAVVRELVGDDNDRGKLITFVGQKAYEAAGGKMVKDLFEHDHVVSDPALLKQLADEKLAAECECLRADGWSWVSTVDDLDFDRWRAKEIAGDLLLNDEEKAKVKELQAALDKINELAFAPGDEEDPAGAKGDDEGDDLWDREQALEDEISAIEEAARARGYTPKQKAKAGCIVEIGFNGELRIETGVIKPGDRAAASSCGDAEHGEEKPKLGLSNALMQRLSEQLTAAVGDCLRGDAALSLASAIAAFKTTVTCGFSAESPVCLSENGLERKKQRGIDDRNEVSFADALASALKLSRSELLDLLAGVVAASIDMQVQNATRPPLGEGEKDNIALIAAIKPKAMRAALAARFDAKDYFGSVSKTLCLDAIKDALGEDQAREVGKLKKAELVAFCVQNVAGTGWLPAEVRTVHYDGPSRSSSEEVAHQKSRAA